MTATSAPAAARNRVATPPRRLRLLLALGVLLGLASVIAAAVGAFPVEPADVLRTILNRAGLPVGVDLTVADVLWQIRFPRVVLALLVGGALGCAGALLQGMFGNPLAEPSIIGVSAGAAVGAVAVIATGLAGLGTWTLPVAAFVGGLAVTLAVYRAARSGGRVETITLVLTGIAVNALAGAVIGLLVFFSDDAQLRTITFWTLGSLGTATWSSALSVAPLALAGLALAPRFARALDLLALGEQPARHLGVDVERLRLRLIVVTAILTAASVAVAGIITFVGLVVPHIVRLITGPRHDALIPASALLGGLVLVLGDLVARTVAAPAEVPLGVLTALLGAPSFWWLLRRTRARQGGWA